MTRSVLGTASRGLLASRTAALALALASSFYFLYSIRFMWTTVGDFGIGFDLSTAIVNDVSPIDAAKGIRPGDRVDIAAMSFRERSYFYYDSVVLPVGMRMTFPFIRSGRRRAVTIEAAPLRFGSDFAVYRWGRRIVAMLFIATGVMLVWNRPSLMLWGLAVFLIRAHPYTFGTYVSPAVAALVIFGYAFIFALGVPGLIMFAARFPDSRRNTATKFWDVAAICVFIFYLITCIHDYVPLFTARPIPDWPDFEYAELGLYVAVFVALCVKLRTKDRFTRAAFRWIVAGYGLGIVIGLVALSVLFEFINLDSDWPRVGQLAVMLAMPASVAYSLIRHRSFGLGYLTNRTLVFVSLTIGVAFTFLIAVWATSGRISSTLGVGTAMFVALLVGMVIQAQRGRAIRFVDRIFLPHRYETGLSLDRIRETLRGTNDAHRVTDEVAATLGLTSVAVFERAEDGGFIRNAAHGWPQGTAWHLLPSEVVTHSLDGAATVIALPDELADVPAFPVAHARPRVALTIRRGGRVERAVLIGSDRYGASLDLDVSRSLHGVFDEALVGE